MTDPEAEEILFLVQMLDAMEGLDDSQRICDSEVWQRRFGKCTDHEHPAPQDQE